MCRSVPQIAVFSTLISTSFGPGAGTGRSCIQMPFPGSRLTSALIVRDIVRLLSGKPRIIRGGPGFPAPTARARPAGRRYTRENFPHVGHTDASHGQHPGARARGRHRHRPRGRRPGGRGHVGPAAAPGDRGPAEAGRPGTAARAARQPHRAADGRGGLAGRLHRQLRFAAGPGGDQPPLRVRRPAAQFHPGQQPDRDRPHRRHPPRRALPRPQRPHPRSPPRPRPNPRISALDDSRDVTAEVKAAIAAAPDAAGRTAALEAIEKRLVSECESEDGFRCRFYSFAGGNTYRLFRNLEIRDVRIVNAPPQSIGAYGGDIDNWMWPRHTGDYTFLRAYVGKDGKPAAFDEGNVPYQPKHWLRLASEPLEAGDFVMVAGYPGRTSRYALAGEFDETAQWAYPQVVE